MFFSSIPGLEALKIKTRSMLTLTEASCKFKLIRSEKVSTSVLQEVHRAERQYKAITSTCKSTAKSNLPLGKRQESLLSNNRHFNGYFPLPNYIRDSKERRRIGRPCILQSC